MVEEFAIVTEASGSRVPSGPVTVPDSAPLVADWPLAVWPVKETRKTKAGIQGYECMIKVFADLTVVISGKEVVVLDAEEE